MSSSNKSYNHTFWISLQGNTSQILVHKSWFRSICTRKLKPTNSKNCFLIYVAFKQVVSFFSGDLIGLSFVWWNPKSIFRFVFYFDINSYLNCLPSLQTNLIFRFLDFVATQTPSSPAASFSTPSTADALTHLAILKGRRDLKEIYLSHFKAKLNTIR